MNGTRLAGLVLLVLGFVMLSFSMWQLDMQLCPREWGSTQDNINYYTNLQSEGLHSMSEMKWTINVELFPNMTAGLAYDLLMIMNFSSSVPLLCGTYLIFSRSKKIGKTA
jgi:hypothetical protein